MVQIKIAHLAGTLVTVLIAIAGSAFTIYSETTSAIQSNTKDIEHMHETFDLKLEPLKDNQEKILEELKELNKTANKNED